VLDLGVGEDALFDEQLPNLDSLGGQASPPSHSLAIHVPIAIG
jgi:hypothetical protein